MAEGLTAHLVARQKSRDHALIALLPAVEQCQRAVAVAKEPQHRRHAVARAVQLVADGMGDRDQRVHHHRGQTIGMDEFLRRPADMAAVGQDLARDLGFEAREPRFETLDVGEAGARTARPPPQPRSAACRRAPRRRCAPEAATARAATRTLSSAKACRNWRARRGHARRCGSAAAPEPARSRPARRSAHCASSIG